MVWIANLIETEADDCLAVKRNQRTLRHGIEDFLSAPCPAIQRAAS
jgi:hypothetical protein